MRHFLNIFIIVLNFFIMMGELYLLNHIGWITLHPAVQIHTLEDSLLSAAAITLVFYPMVYVIWFAYSIFVLATLGLGCLLYPFVLIGGGYGVLRMIAAVMPAFLSVTDNFWIGSLAGLTLLYLGIPYLSSDKTSSGDDPAGEVGQHVRLDWEVGSVNMLPQEVANEQKAIIGEKAFHKLELGDEPNPEIVPS